jgi:hypothetical protein
VSILRKKHASQRYRIFMKAANLFKVLHRMTKAFTSGALIPHAKREALP